MASTLHVSVKQSVLQGSVLSLLLFLNSLILMTISKSLVSFLVLKIHANVLHVTHINDYSISYKCVCILAVL